MTNQKTTISTSLLNIFKQYVEFDTSLSSGINYLAAIKLLEQQISKYGFKTQVLKIPKEVANGDNRYNLIAKKITDDKLPTILFYNHIDTVPADYINAFKFTIKDQRAFGRGTCDEKGSTIAILSALKNVNKVKFNLIFIATTDEETDQKAQLDYLAIKLNLPKDTIVFDADTEAGGVTIANLGLLQFNLLLKGKAIHSAISHLGINAIEKSTIMTSFLLDIQKEYEHEFSKYNTFPKEGLTRACNRLNVNMIKGGIAPNVVPDKCTLTIDCRYIPEKDVEKEKEKLFVRIKQFAEKNKLHIEINNVQTIEGCATEHQLIEELNSIYGKITGEYGKYAVMGSTNVSEWAKKLKLPHFGIGVIRSDNNIHGVGEFVYLKDIENLSLTLEKFLT